MATFNKFNSFVEYWSEGVVNFATDTFTVALCNAANPPNAATHSVLLDLTPIAYTNLSSLSVGTAVSSSQTGGTYTLDLTDLVLTASGTVAGFRYVVLYDDTPAATPTDPLMGWYDYGSDLVLLNTETLTITFNASGVLTLA